MIKDVPENKYLSIEVPLFSIAINLKRIQINGNNIVVMSY
ncbi:hypothetical protein B4116_5598 [Bacillus cereus]|nr:hypothetical protein B4116_5598 [Bacillus cereus]KZD56367.1 hypothetical protein B4085_0702 [Bacillus cereus]